MFSKCFAIIFTEVHINLVDTKTKLSLMSSLDFANTRITRVDTLVSMPTKIIEQIGQKMSKHEPNVIL